ncbi:MAG: hypothetical protein ACRBM6_33830, partial [Geminicoccales bacterium]
MSMPRLKQVTVFYEIVVGMINSGGSRNQRLHRVVIRQISLDRSIPICRHRSNKKSHATLDARFRPHP